MMNRTSRKQMHEAEKALRAMFDNDTIWAAGEYDATGRAYIRHNGKVTAYRNNTEAYMAATEIIFAADEI